MNQIIKTKIDGVPVEIEIAKMGPATASEIKDLEINIASEDKNYVISSSQQAQQIRIVRIGDDGKPASEEDISKVKNALQNNKDTATFIQNLTNSIQNPPAGKDFWQSKVFWINTITVIGTLTAYFGFDFKAHNIDPEMVATIVTTIIGLLNLYFRRGTATPWNPVSQSIKKVIQK